VLVLGIAGSGKSATINAMLGREVRRASFAGCHWLLVLQPFVSCRPRGISLTG